MWISSGTTARASLVAHMVKNPPATQETWVWSLGWEDPLEEGMAPHSSILARKIPWTEEPGGLQSMGSLRVGHNWAPSLSLFTFMHWRRKWQPAPAFCLENPRGREAWRAVQSMSSQQDVTEQPSTAQPQPSSLTLQLLLTQAAASWVPSPSCLFPSEFTPICLYSVQRGTPSYKWSLSKTN